MLCTNVNAQQSKDNLVQKAEEEILKSNYTGALPILNEAIAKNPENHLSYFLRGFAKKELGDQIGAYADFTTTINLHPGFSKAYYFRSIQKIDFKDYYSALTDLNKAISYNVTNSDYYVARGYLYNILKDTTNALHDYNTAIFLYGENSNAYLNKSLLELDMKQYDKAFENINKAISISPYYMTAFIIRAYIELSKKDSIAAKNDYEFVITKDSTQILAYYNLALVYHGQKNFEKALANYNKVVSLNPFHAECFYNRAALFAEKERYVEAIEDYNHVISLNPVNIYAYFNRAIVKQYISDFTGAVADLSKVIELYPKFLKAYVLRSNVNIQLKNYKAAEADKNTANYLSKATKDSLSFFSSDSAYLMPLLDFRSEYQALDTNQGHVQFKTINVMQKHYYSLIPDNESRSYSSYNEQIEVLNRNKAIYLKLRIDNKDSKLSYENIAESKTLLDSLSSKQPKMKESNLLWDAILDGMLKNYGEALKSASKIPDSTDFGYLSSFLKANFYLKIGEQEENTEFNSPFIENKVNTGINKNYQLAIEALSASINANSKFTYSYYNRAYAKTLINDISGAIIDYSSCIYFDKNFTDAYYNRGLLYVLSGDIESACKDFSKAGELGVSEAYSLLYRYCK